MPSVWVKLDPLVDLVWKNVKESADPATQALLANVQVPQNVRVKATDLTHSQADSIGQALNLVSYWGIAYLVAAVLLVAGMPGGHQEGPVGDADRVPPLSGRPGCPRSSTRR